MKPRGALSPLMAPTEPLERVRFIGHGGGVAGWMEGLTGTYVGQSARAGHPIIMLDDSPRAAAFGGPRVVLDRYGCGACIDRDGNLIRTP